MGTSVRVCPSLTSALIYVAATLKNQWAGGWVIHGPDGERIADGPNGSWVVSVLGYDEEQDETAAVLHLQDPGRTS